MLDERARLVRFDTFEADLRSGEVWNRGVKLKLGEQPFSVLAVLLARPGDIVTREELQASLWPADTFVDFDRGLNKAINRLRDALGDSADAPRFIETLPKRGYRFIARIDPPELPDSSERTPAIERTPDSDATRSVPITRSPPRVRGVLAWAGAAAIALAVTVSALWSSTAGRSAPDDRGPLIRSSVLPPAERAFVPDSLALSRDGTHLAFAAEAPDGSRSLWVRAMSGTASTQIAGTDGARFPFWSPDLRQIGFFADRKLKVVDVAGGDVRVLADAPRASGASWSAEDAIVFAPDVNGPLLRVAAAGGTPVPVSRLPGGEGMHGHRWPVFLPDGRQFLFIAFNAAAPSDNAPELRIGSLDTLESRPIAWAGGRSVAYARGRLLYVRGGSLYTQPFDADTGRTLGPEAPLAGAELTVAPAFFPSALAVSANGVLVFQAAGDLASKLVWLDARGQEQSALPVTYSGPAISPDGGRLAGSCDGPRAGTQSICVFDLQRGVGSRITDGPTDRFPVWSADGYEIAYSSDAGIHRVRADGSRSPQFVSRHGHPTTWLRDGRILSFGSQNGIVSLALSSPVTHHVAEWGPGAEGQLSPDAGWLAAIAPDGLVAQRFPGGEPRVTIATRGANQPRWSRDGRQIFYIRSDKKLMAVDFDVTDGAAGAARVVAQTGIIGAGLVGFQYDVAPDGRFIVNLVTGRAGPLTLMSGWAPMPPR